jgi:CBS-domain-containing membrane protein/rubredoxin
MRVGDLMTHEVTTINPDASLDELAKVLSDKDISSLPVTTDGRLVGVVSESDVIAKSGDTVADIMTTTPLTATQDMSLSEVADLLTSRRIKRLPVVSGQSVVGMISQRDLVRGMAGGILHAEDLGHELKAVKSGAVHETRAVAMELVWRCDDCGYLVQNAENPPDKCPQCGAPREHFESVTED